MSPLLAAALGFTGGNAAILYVIRLSGFRITFKRIT